MFYFIIAVGLLVLVGKLVHSNIEAKKRRYDRALRGRDKRAALEAGRAYYSAMRGGKLTIYDEQAIANDMSAMKID